MINRQKQDDDDSSNFEHKFHKCQLKKCHIESQFVYAMTFSYSYSIMTRSNAKASPFRHESFNHFSYIHKRRLGKICFLNAAMHIISAYFVVIFSKNDNIIILSSACPFPISGLVLFNIENRLAGQPPPPFAFAFVYIGFHTRCSFQQSFSLFY